MTEKQKWQVDLDKLALLTYKIIYTLSFFILLLLTITGFFTSAYIHLDLGERITFLSTSPFFIIFILLALFLLLIVRKKISKKVSSSFFLKGSLIFMAINALVLLIIQPRPRFDALAVLVDARRFNQGNFESLTTQGGYLYLNPHQLGLVTLERFYLTVAQGPWIGYLANLFYAVGIIFFQYKIAKIFDTNRVTNNLLILFNFLFLPLFFHVGFLYGLLPGMFFILVGFYHLIRFYTSSSNLSLPIAFLSLMVGVLIRKNYLIFLLALIIIHCLLLVQEFHIKKVIGLLVVLCAIPLGSALLNSYYSSQTNQPIPKGTPNTAYLAMGLRDNEHTPALGGWWDNYNTSLLAVHHYDQKEAAQAARKELTSRLYYLTTHPSYAYKFFSEKIISTWLEPTFQSIWSEARLTPKPNYTNPLLKSMYDEGFLYHFFHFWCLLITIIIYGFSAFYLFSLQFIKKMSLQPLQLYSLLFFLGGFTFHLIWETKSQYVFIYILLLIPLAAQGFNDFSTLLIQYLKNDSGKQPAKHHSRRQVNKESLPTKKDLQLKEDLQPDGL